MQQTTEPIAHEQINRERAQLSKLQTAAIDAQAEAERWKTTFEREPTAQAHTSMAVAEQKAKNARAAAERFEQETLGPLLASDQRAAHAAECEQILREIDWRIAEEKLERLEKAITGAQDEAVAASRELVTFLIGRWNHMSRAQTLGLPMSPAHMEQLLGGVREKLAARAKDASGNPLAQLTAFDMGVEKQISVAFTVPVHIPSMVW